MLKKITLTLAATAMLLVAGMVAQGFLTAPKQTTQVKWLDFKTALAANKKKSKPLYIDVYTDWCGWCKKMDKTTFEDPEVVALLNQGFYPIKFDAEQSASISFNGKLFEKRAGERTHALAIAMLNGQMSYPSTVFFNEKQEIITVVPGYLSADDLKPILNYIAKGIYKTKSWEEYQKTN